MKDIGHNNTKLMINNQINTIKQGFQSNKILPKKK
jgi:hypothetical protein